MLGADRAALPADQDARVPLGRFRALILAAKAATGDPAFVLHHAAATRIEDHSVAGLIIHACRSMAEAVAQLNRCGRLMVEVDLMDGAARFSAEIGPEGARIIGNRPDPDAFPELTESAFGRFAAEFRREFPDRPFARALEVTHAAPDQAAAYGEVLRCPVRFGAPRNAMLIDAARPGQEFGEHNGYVFGLPAERAEALMAELSAAECLPARIEALLLPDLHKGAFSAEAAAAPLGMSRQTR